MGKKDKKTISKKTSQNIYSDQEQFIDRLGAAGVTRDNLRLISDRLRYERAQAELKAIKIYCEAEGFLHNGGKVNVGELVSLVLRRCQALQIAVEGVADELGKTSTNYLGLSQLAWDVTNLTERVETAINAEATVEWAKRNAIA